MQLFTSLILAKSLVACGIHTTHAKDFVKMHIEVQEGVMMGPNAMAKFHQSSCIFAFPPSTCQAAHKDNGLKTTSMDLLVNYLPTS
jgi:hypothetical protein